MTSPTLTYGHGWLHDGDSTTTWTEHLTNMVDADATLTSQLGDVLRIEAKFDDAAAEQVYYQYDFTDLSSDTYSKIAVRWKTSEASNGAAAKVQLVFTGPSTQDVLAESFSTSWTVTTADITPAKTIDQIRLFAMDDPDSLDSGTYYVYYDFVLIHKGTFTVPGQPDEDLVVEGLHRYVDIPGRVGSDTQILGLKSPTIRLRGDMSQWQTWDVASSGTYGDAFLRVMKDAVNEPWNWYTSDLINCKATMPRLRVFKEAGSKVQRQWEATLRLHSLSDGDDATIWPDLEWLGL